MRASYKSWSAGKLRFRRIDTGNLFQTELVRVECKKNKEYKYFSCVPGVDGKIHPEGVVQHRR